MRSPHPAGRGLLALLPRTQVSQAAQLAQDACPLCALPPRRRETAENWDREIAEDVAGECSKYGGVEHVYVDKASRGFVYLVSPHPPARLAALVAMPGASHPAALAGHSRQGSQANGTRHPRSRHPRAAPPLAPVQARPEVPAAARWEARHQDLPCPGLPRLRSPLLQKFNSVPAAANAQRALHGRWFAARQIAADFQVRGLLGLPD